MSSNIGVAFLKRIMLDEQFSYIDDLDVRWFSDDDRTIFKACAYLYLTKKHASYEQVKALIEVAQDIKDWKRDDLLKRLEYIKDTLVILPVNNPISQFKREWILGKCNELLIALPHLEYENKIALIKKMAEDFTEDIADSNTFILQEEINIFADELEKGEANDNTGSIDLSNYHQRNGELSAQMYRWITILGASHIMPKFYLFGARPGSFKTSLLIDLNVMLHRLNYRGLYFSFEDTKDDLRMKFIAQMYSIDKKYLYSVRNDKNLAEKIRKPKDEKIIIHDRCIDYDKLIPTVEYYVNKYKVDYISLDYVQLFTGKATIKDRLDVVAQDIMEVTRKWKIPFFCLSQVTKNDTDKDADDSRLHKRHVKDSKKLSETPRWMGFLYGDNHTSTRTLNRDKNTLGGCGEVIITFDGPTGRITEVVQNDK